MLSVVQRRIIFLLFCVLTGIFACVEAYVIWAFIEKGLNLETTIGGLLSTGLLAGCGTIFLKIVEATFLHEQPLPLSALHHYASDRSSILTNAAYAGQPQFEQRKALVTNTLRMAEQTLRGWVLGAHFELCVFVDRHQPLLFAYYDTRNHAVARSMAHRAANPNFYVEQGYEVTKVLASPSSQPRIINDTEADDDYTFATDAQRKQIRSTMLLALDLQAPLALVISSDAKNAFSDTNLELMEFMRFVGELIRCDLVSNGFVEDVRGLKPELFQAANGGNGVDLPALQIAPLAN